MGVIRILVLFLRGVLRNRTELAAENLALRQQLAILQQKSKPPRLRRRDRIFWAILSQIWTGWRSALLIVQPDTVVLSAGGKNRPGRGGLKTGHFECLRVCRTAFPAMVLEEAGDGQSAQGGDGAFDSDASRSWVVPAADCP
jgi:hypothetical protein